MPLLTTTNDVAVGMRLHEPVRDGDSLLLPAGKVLNSADVDFLRARVPGCPISVEDPVLDKLVAFDDDRRDREVARTVQRQLMGLLSDVQADFAARMSMKSRDCRGIEQGVRGVLAYLDRHPVIAMHLVRPGADEDYLTTHAAQVFYLSLVLGNTVRSRVAEARRESINRHGMPPRDINLSPLALSALFMDIAMLPMKDLVSQVDPLTDEQVRRIRQHPIRGAEMLPPETPEVVKLIVETHHENYDGTGYPFGLRGDEIHIFARILRIADAYAAATASHVYREACSPISALWQMTWGGFARFYDPVLMKIFAGLMQPYPIGAKVRLSSGEYGVVVRFGELSPFLPEVIIAFDEQDRRLPPGKLKGPIKLHEASDLKIVSFGGEDVSDLYARDTRIAPVTGSEFTTLYESIVTGCATTPGPG